jgi:hypothetical protein
MPLISRHRHQKRDPFGTANPRSLSRSGWLNAIAVQPSPGRRFQSHCSPSRSLACHKLAPKPIVLGVHRRIVLLVGDPRRPLGHALEPHVACTRHPRTRSPSRPPSRRPSSCVELAPLRDTLDVAGHILRRQRRELVPRARGRLIPGARDRDRPLLPAACAAPAGPSGPGSHARSSDLAAAAMDRRRRGGARRSHGRSE